MTSTFRLNRTSNGVTVNRTLNTLGVVTQPSQGPRGADSGHTYGNVAALAALGERPADQTTAVLRGYHAPGDGGGGTFYYECDSTRVVDGGMVLAGAYGTDVWVRRWAGERRNPRWWGARGRTGGATGVAGNDDAAALQAAMNCGPGDLWLDDVFPVAFPVVKPSGVSLYGGGAKHSGIDGSLLTGTVPDTSVPGQTINVAAAVWASGSVTELAGFAGARAGENVVRFADTSSLSPGDVLIFSNETGYSFSSSREAYRDGCFRLVHNVNSATDVRLNEPLPTTFDPVDDLHVYRVEPVRGSLNDLLIIAKPGYSGYHEKWGYDNTHLRLSQTGSDTHNGWLDRCYKCKVIEGSIQDQSDVGLAEGETGGTNYGWMVGNSEECSFLGGSYEVGRHGITTGGDTTKCAIVCRNIVANGVTLGAQRDTSFTDGAITVVSRTTGTAGCNEIQAIDARAVGAGNTFTVKYGSAPSVALGGAATAAQLQAALSAIVPGSVTVLGTTAAANPFLVFIGGALAFTNVVLLTATGGAVVTAVLNGTPAANEVQRVDATTATTGVTAGQRGFAFRGYPTPPVAYDAPAATVQAALEALPTIGAGNVVVTGGPLHAATIDVTYQNALAQTNVELLAVASTVGVTTITPGAAGTHAAWTLDARLVGAGNTFNLTYGGQTTREIGNTAIAPLVEAALEALPNVGVGNMRVTAPSAVGTAANAVLTITPCGTLAYQNLTPPTAAATHIGTNPPAVAPTVTVLATGAAGTNSVQRVDARAVGANGTFVLLVAGQYTGTLNGDAPVATIQAALELLPNVGPGGAVVTGTDATATFDVTAGAVNGSRAMPRIEGGVAFVQTPYSGSNHGNIDGMKWIGCTFNNGLSTGGRNVEVIGCTSYGNMESGVAYLWGEMSSPRLVIDGGRAVARANFGVGAGLIYLTYPPSCVETGTSVIRNLSIDMGGFQAASGVTAAISVNHDAYDPYGSHPPNTPVAQQDMDLSICNLQIDSAYPAGVSIPAYWLNVTAGATVNGKGFRNLTISDVVANGMGARIYNNDPQRLSIRDYRCYAAREYGLYVMANRAASKYANSVQSLSDSEISGAYKVGAYLVGSNNGADSATTPTDKHLILHDNTIIDNVAVAASPTPSTNFQGNYYIAGYVDVDSKHNTEGETAASTALYSDTHTPSRSRVGAVDFVTTLREERNTVLGGVTAENRGAGVITRLLHRVAATAPGTTAAGNGSTWIYTGGGAGTTFYVREAGTWVPK